MLEKIVREFIEPDDKPRLEALKKLNDLEARTKSSLNKITAIIAQVFKTPIAFISFLGPEHVHYIAHSGSPLNARLLRSDSMCENVIAEKELLIIEDSLLSDFKTNSFIASNQIRFYAAAPLMSADGYAVGTVSIGDDVPRSITVEEKNLLVNFAQLVMHEIDLRNALQEHNEIQQELTKARLQLNTALEVGEITPWHWDLVNNKAFGGIEFARLFNVSKTETEEGISANYFINSIVAEDRPLVFERVKHCLATGDKYHAEYRVVNFKKEIRWVLARGIVQYQDSVPVSITGTLIDITDTKKAENEIKEKSKEIVFITENMPQLIWATYADGLAYYFSGQWEKYTGLPPYKLSGKQWLSVLHPNDVEHVSGIWQQALERKSFYEVEFRLRRHDGEYRWFLSRGTPMKDEQNEVLKWYGTTTDIHDQKIAEIELNRFRYMADHAQDPFILMREDGTFAYLNEKALQAWGYTYDEAKLLRVPDVDPVYHDEIFKDIFDKVQLGYVPKIETLHKHRNGNIFPVEVNMGALVLDGEPHMFAVARDITERKQAEIALKQSKERFELVAKATQDAIWDWDLETNLIWWNEGFKTLFHYKDEDIEKGIESWYNRIHPDDTERIVGGIHKVIDNGGSQWSDEYRFKRADGTYAIVFDRGYALYNENGKPVRMLGSMQDISRRKEYEQALVQSEASTRLAVNSASLGTFEVNINKQEMTYSPRSGEIFGFDSNTKYTYQNFVNSIHTDDIIIRQQAHVIASQTGNLSYEARIVTALGELKWIRLNGTRIQREKEEFLIGTVMDITAEKEASNLLEQKIKERTRELQAANEQLQQFTYAASHDLQEPLRKISLFIDRLMNSVSHDLNPEHIKLADKIQSTANRMRNLINDLLEYSNTSFNNVTYATVDLNQLMNMVQEDMEAAIEETGAVMSVGNLPTVPGDKRQLIQLFHNLVSNALKYHKRDEVPRVDISGKLVNGRDVAAHISIMDIQKTFYYLTVTDNGIGFEQENAKDIFGLFQRLHGRAEYDGTGIGLAICKKVVENHNGSIWATSTINSGSTFHILIPAA